MADLGFGLMRLPLRDPDDQTSIDMDTLKVMVDEFLDAGFDYFDTAYYYHANSSERAIREALVERHPRSSFRLATKMPMKLLESEEQQGSSCPTAAWSTSTATCCTTYAGVTTRSPRGCTPSISS